MDVRFTRWLAVAGMLAGAPSALAAQGDLIEEEVRWFFGFPSWTFELNAGVANTGRLLLQAVDDEPGIVPQRELRAGNSFSYGGSVGVTILPRTGARLAFTRTSADLDFRDDTGDGSDDLDVDNVAGLSSNTLSFEVIRLLLPRPIKLTPYAGGGVAVVWYKLDTRGSPPQVIGGDRVTLTRMAGVGVAGFQYRVSDQWTVRVEGTTFAIHNPFTGESSYVATSGFTIDEPPVVRQSHFRISGSYAFATPSRPLR